MRQPASTQTSQDVVYIAVMGVTGAGKSTFINHCTHQDVPIGHEMSSCTQMVQEYDCRLNGVNIKLVDTPGFDDTNRSDTQVLTEVASWLTSTYSQNTKLRGIIYLHRITDRRMSGSAMKNIVMFRNLCGKEAFRHVILATTMWEQVDTEEGIRREEELESTDAFWGAMIRYGSRIERHTNDQQSALRLLSMYISADSNATDFVVDLQKQMVDDKLKLNQTEAGKSLEVELNKERERAQKEMRDLRSNMEEAIRMKDEEIVQQLRAQEQDMNRKIQRLHKEQAEMNNWMQQEHERKRRELEQLLSDQRSLAKEQARAAAEREARNRQLWEENQRVAREERERLQRLVEEQARLQQQQDAALRTQDAEHKRELAKLQRQLTNSSIAAPVQAGPSSSLSGPNVPTTAAPSSAPSKALAPMPRELEPVAPEVSRIDSLSISGLYYCFTGARSMRCHLPPDGQVDRDTTWIMYMAIGIDGSWYRHEKDKISREANTVIAQGMEKSPYKGFKSSFKADKPFGRPTCVSFGPNGLYFANIGGKRFGHFGTERDAILSEKRDSDIKMVWFGCNQAYVAVFTDGRFIHDLKGLYPSLQASFERINVPPIAVAMNLEDGTEHVVAYPRGGFSFRVAGRAFQKPLVQNFLRLHGYNA